MGKRYDWQVTQQNTPRFRERRILFLVAMGIFVLNLILAGVFLAVNMKNMICFLLYAVLLTVVAVLQCFDRRREMWTWNYLEFWFVFSFAASAGIILWYQSYLWFVGYGVELIAFIILARCLLKRKNRKKHKR